MKPHWARFTRRLSHLWSWNVHLLMPLKHGYVFFNPWKHIPKNRKPSPVPSQALQVVAIDIIATFFYLMIGGRVGWIMVDLLVSIARLMSVQVTWCQFYGWCCFFSRTSRELLSDKVKRWCHGHKRCLVWFCECRSCAGWIGLPYIIRVLDMFRLSYTAW